MIPPLYIKSACAISPQHSYNEAAFLQPVVGSNTGMLYVIDPDYTQYISPVAIRRMSRLLKRGITAGMRCLENAGITTPDGIIIGTARGSVTDMEVFLHDMINLNEQALNPTGFIQSTYNSVNGWLAMISKCNGYSQTYVHRGLSFELCIMDAQMLMAETTGEKNILIGGIDELTPEYCGIRKKIGYYKENMPDTLSVLAHSDTPGSIGGEGAQFFVVSNVKGNSACAVHSMQMLHHPSSELLLATMQHMLLENKLTTNEIDILLCGMNGDSRVQFLIEPLLSMFSKTTTVAAFKHLCGEYDTASGFGLWLADFLFKQQQLPPEVIHRQGTSQMIRNVLFCNVTITGDVSVMMLKSA